MGTATTSPSRRTTVTLSAESQEIVERFKAASGASASAAIDALIKRNEPKPSRLKSVNGFLVLDLPPGRRSITLEDVKEAEDKMDHEYIERLSPRKKKSKRGRTKGTK